MNIIEMISAVIFAPISEEILFRGIVLNQIMKKHSFLFANIIQAGIFAILHCDLRTFAFLFLVGIMLGIVYNYLNLYCSILIHSLNNLINVLLMNTSIEFINLQKQEYLIIGIVFFVITAGLLYKIKTNKNMI
jgi:membrane protease YdiL (CAAX protease family)